MNEPSSNRPQHKPPRVGVWILEMIYNNELYDEIYGDLYEIYLERIVQKGKVQATLHFLKDSILSIRNYNLRKRRDTMPNNTLALISNYVRSTLRMMNKNRGYAALNILGLALGIAACLFILQYVSYQRSYDKFHENHENLYRVVYKNYRNGELNIDCAAAVPRVGPFMKDNNPEVIDYARVYPMTEVVSYNDLQFRENRMHMTDPSFLKIFTFPLIMGDVETALKEPNKVVITEDIARKYFGRDDPMGKFLKINGTETLEVTGVAANVPDNSHFKFDFLVSFETLNNQTRNDDGSSASETSWGWYDFNTYVLLQPGTDSKAFDLNFEKQLWEERGDDFERYNFKAEFPLQAITDIHLYSDLLQESEPEEQGDGRAVSFLTIIAFFILLIAWINYVNLSTARSIERSREVGVRKTLGATPKQLIQQFLMESLLLNVISLVIALGIVILGIRYFNQLTDSSLDLAFLLDRSFWLTMIGVLLAGSIIAGLYPAFVLSSFSPVSVFKGSSRGRNSGNILRQMLVVFQFAASVTLIASTLIVYRQLSHMTNLDLGFNMTETLVVKGPAVFANDSLFSSTTKNFKNELLSYAQIAAVTASSNVPGEEIFWTNAIKRVEEEEDRFRIIYNAGVDYDYFDTYDISLIAGRNYSLDHSIDSASLILNEAATRMLGFESPESAIYKKVTFWGKPKSIIGVVKDYFQMSAKSKVASIAFPLIEESSSYYTIKLVGQNHQQTLNKIQAAYETIFPGNPYDYFFLDDFFNRQYKNDRTFSRVFTLFACFAVFVACLGLFGLSSFTILKRSKEIGIRKILGAGVPRIVQLLSKEFLWLVLIANLVAWPAIYLLMNQWLSHFASRISMDISVFLISGLLVVVIAMLTVSYKIFTTAMTNPVEAIRLE